MNRGIRLCKVALCALLLTMVGGAKAWAQKTVVPSRVAEAVDDARTVRLKGNVHPLARSPYDQGALAESQPMTRMMLLLQRSPEREAALRQLLEDQQNKGSANYHAWLTPEQFGKQFGPSDADVQAVTDWLTQQGFTVGKVTAGRIAVEFSGTVAQVQNAFHTQLHRYAVGGEEHFANAAEPAIPEALSPVVGGVMGLHNFRKRPFVHHLGKFRKDTSTGQITPLFTYTEAAGGPFYGVGPADFDTIYHVPTTTFDGTGQSIAVVGRVNILLQDVRDFRTMFGLPAKDPQIILNGPDPGLIGPDGTTSDEGESALDVEWAGAVASGANVIFVTTQMTQTDGVDGVDASAIYAVENNVAGVLSDSYGICESSLGTSGNAFYNALWEQAAAQGITVVVAAGDNGAAGCDDPSSQSAAVGGIAVSGLASTPYNIAMGGTDFTYTNNNQSTYWNSNGSNNVYPSAKSYIPELPWNDSCAAAGLAGCTGVSSTSSSLNIVAASGGPSAVYPKPNWQHGTSVPADGARDLPDVSLFSGDGNNGSFYIICQSDQNIPGDTGCNLTSRSPTAPYHDFQAVGGTSAATPTFAGIIALVNQKTGQRQGTANYALYNLANTAGVYHDINTGNNSVPCAGHSPDCSNTSSTTGAVGVLTTTAGGNTLAYAAGTGYDMATGLGTMDVTNLVNAWTSPIFTGTNVNLASISPSTFTVGGTVAIGGTVTKTSGTGTPSGVVVLENATTGAVLDSSLLDSGGTFNGWQSAFLPGGTYNVKVHYGGDGTFGSSDSNAMSVTGNKVNSQVIVSWVGATGALSTAAQNVTYGSPYILRIDVTNSNGTACQSSAGTVTSLCPTGTISLFRNSGVPLNDFQPTNPGGTLSANQANLNDRGFAEDQPIQLSVGTYSITAQYSGDSSYNAQTNSNPLAVTITQAATQTTVTSSLSSITAGTSVTLTATVATNSNGEAPCGITGGGTVQFTNGGTPLTGTVTYTPASGASSSTGSAFCTAALTTAISGLYPPTTRPPRPTVPVLPLMFALACLALFALGMRWVPQTRRRAYAYAGLVAIALLVGVVAGCGGGSGGGGGGGGGGGSPRTIGATYSGDTNYQQSAGTTTITVQ